MPWIAYPCLAQEPFPSIYILEREASFKNTRSSSTSLFYIQSNNQVRPIIFKENEAGLWGPLWEAHLRIELGASKVLDGACLPIKIGGARMNIQMLLI